MKLCPKCNYALNPDGVRWCGRCGYKFDPDAVPPGMEQGGRLDLSRKGATSSQAVDAFADESLVAVEAPAAGAPGPGLESAEEESHFGGDSELIVDEGGEYDDIPFGLEPDKPAQSSPDQGEPEADAFGDAPEEQNAAGETGSEASQTPDAAAAKQAQREVPPWEQEEAGEPGGLDELPGASPPELSGLADGEEEEWELDLPPELLGRRRPGAAETGPRSPEPGPPGPQSTPEASPEPESAPGAPSPLAPLEDDDVPDVGWSLEDEQEQSAEPTESTEPPGAAMPSPQPPSPEPVEDTVPEVSWNPDPDLPPELLSESEQPPPADGERSVGQSALAGEEESESDPEQPSSEEHPEVRWNPDPNLPPELLGDDEEDVEEGDGEEDDEDRTP